ncbi:sec-independent translocase [Streptomyces sp. NPDC048845]|uniref:sec-independent translocase n=1 Tax=Streptomyces sp. NPDC048845 TaxID=3155390 RepID=UPI00344723D1
MFNDIGALEIAALVILAVLVFGPDKLPKVIQDVSRTVRKIRQFSDSAKEDIRSELGPEFKDFEFEDLNPKNFVRKQLMDNDDLGIKEIRNEFDLRKEMNEVADAVHGRDGDASGSPGSSGSADSSGGAPESGSKLSLTKSSGTSGSSGSGPDLLRKQEKPAQADRPPFDVDAT